ncbi:hypothetical protein [Ottowia sp.]|uniref:hypothetical protein n=1 Tax=Ottowia sp. TaxID=1898956 RepID=UPI0025D4F0CB|nr:hypothetical protein [Ottowia sp.]MBK6613632.1 hypothetical protein [Ottowia sp.]
MIDRNLSHDATDPVLEVVGNAYFDHRAAICESRQEGFTAIYNLVHSPDETSEDVVRFRQLIGELDRAVINSYGWQDIELNHAFFETKRGTRYGVDGPSRSEILKRLTVLNRERFEAAASSSRPSTATKSKRGRRPKAAPSVIGDGLFDEGEL